MKILSGLALLATLAAGSAYAHTHLTSSVPADGGVFTAAPPAFELKFSEATRLTALTLQKAGGAAQKLTPLPTSTTAAMKIPAPKLTAGKYTLEWRAVGDDGHVMTGKIQFTIAPDGAPKAGTSPQTHQHAH